MHIIIYEHKHGVDILPFQDEAVADKVAEKMSQITEDRYGEYIEQQYLASCFDDQVGFDIDKFVTDITDN